MKAGHKWVALAALVIGGICCLTVDGTWSLWRKTHAPKINGGEDPPSHGSVSLSLEVKAKSASKSESAISQAISQKWPNVEVRALISMTRSPDLVAELWSRQPLDAQDLCVLALHSGTKEQRLKAAGLWAELEPNNAEPRYTLFLEKWLNQEDKEKIIPELYELIKLGQIDSYFAERSIAYDLVAQTQGLSPKDGISPLDANDTNTKAYNMLNLLSKFAATSPNSDVTSKEKLAGLCAGLSSQILAKKGLRMQEYQSAIVSELQVLNQLEEQTEYGRENFTVLDRKSELKRKSQEDMNMMRICNDAFVLNTGLTQLFKQRAQALGEYEAYQQVHAIIRQ